MIVLTGGEFNYFIKIISQVWSSKNDTCIRVSFIFRSQVLLNYESLPPWVFFFFLLYEPYAKVIIIVLWAEDISEGQGTVITCVVR